MKLRATNHSPAGFAARGRAAFSLIEVLVVTGLLSVIIIGLVLMFSQTQRAYKLGTTQVDVLEGGRMVTDILTRELTQLTPANRANSLPVVNCYVLTRNINPLAQPLAGSVSAYRTNITMDLMFFTRENQDWTGIGYTVLDPISGGVPVGGIGSLYRYSSNAFRGAELDLARAFNGFLVAPPTNMSRMLDGVVHFKVRTFTPGGDWIAGSLSNDITNRFQLISSPVAYYPFGETELLYFHSNAVPATVEVEIGVLESKEIERARSITDATARANYLKQQAGKVHIFRWRVAIRNFDPAAYQ